MNFEAIFGVPPSHRLEQVRSRARAGAVDATFWAHEEYDASGRLVARYESFRESDVRTGALRSGWRKYAPTGVLLETSEALPPRAMSAA
jgi:hypothetical protein